jgi:hypothetical protein
VNRLEMDVHLVLDETGSSRSSFRARLRTLAM